jgi:hypothetical protein
MTEQPNRLAIWNAVEQTDPDYTKSFNRGGGFKGTSTNATYLAKKATNQFGPIGIGWGYNVIDETYQPGQDKDIIHVVRIKLWYEWNGKRGEIEHFGQTQFVGKNKNGYYTDEEAPKKSLTDAVSKCLSLLGFAADIHLGMYDDNRYVNDLKRNFGDEFDDRPANNDNQRGGDRQQQPSDKAIEDLIINLEGKIRDCKTIADVTDLMNSKDMKDGMKDLTKAEIDDLRAFATQRLKDLGWSKPAKGEQAEAANG